MNEDTLNKAGVTSQREIEHRMLKAVESGELSDEKALAVKMTLSIPAIGLNHQIEGEIALE